MSMLATLKRDINRETDMATKASDNYDATDDAVKSYYAAIEAKRQRGDAEKAGAAVPPWPADSVQRMPTATLLPYARNARTHAPAQIAQLAASMREWGFTIPVLVDENLTIIAGHGRVLAAQKLGFESVPVMVARGWTDGQIKAYRIADNQLALNAAWDDAMLGLDLAELEAQLQHLTGLADAQIASLLAHTQQGLTDPDEVPPLPEQPIARPGDLWRCGKHRILCGDATNAEDVAKLLGGVKPNLMVTDPPYGVEYDADWRNRADRANGKPYGASAIRPVPNDERIDWRDAYALFPGQIAYVWHAGRHASEVQRSLEAATFAIRCQIVWAKTRFVISRGDYHWQHEPCWYAVRKKGHWTGDRSQSTLWTIDHQVSETGHSTQKPVECMRRPIVNNSSPGQAVYDPFLGSGTTVIAAEMEGRSAFCLEISPAYVDVAVQRWQNFTGLKAQKS